MRATDFEIGKEYIITHKKMGTFGATASEIRQDVVEFVITDGSATIGDDTRGPGDSISLHTLGSSWIAVEKGEEEQE